MRAALAVAACLGCLAATASVSAAPINLVTFDGAKGTTFDWAVMNDPVMGGLSSSNFSGESQNTVLGDPRGRCGKLPQRRWRTAADMHVHVKSVACVVVRVSRLACCSVPSHCYS